MAKWIVRSVHLRATTEHMDNLAARDRGRLEVRTVENVSTTFNCLVDLVFSLLCFRLFFLYGSSAGANRSRKKMNPQ